MPDMTPSRGVVEMRLDISMCSVCCLLHEIMHIYVHERHEILLVHSQGPSKANEAFKTRVVRVTPTGMTGMIGISVSNLLRRQSPSLPCAHIRGLCL